MILTHLELLDFRHFEAAELHPVPRWNILLGPNGSGKTSFLEAVYLLSRARSFRTSHVNQLIRLGQSATTVVGHLASEPEGTSMPLGVRITRGHRELHLNGKGVYSSTECARVFPVQVIQPSVLSLLEGTPKLRRHFLDLGIFYENPHYLSRWRSYIKALHQRNALLKQDHLTELSSWNYELARYGTILAEARCHYAEQLAPYLKKNVAHFFPGRPFELRVQTGWEMNVSLFSVLERDIRSDQRCGYTQSGPHKGDFTVLSKGQSVKAYLSRGEMKLLVYALLLAQTQCLEHHIESSRSVVLIDDIFSELDELHQRALIKILHEGETQYFMTATYIPHSIKKELVANKAVFHILSGQAHRTQ